MKKYNATRGNIRVYPNPAFNFIVVEVDDQEPIQIFNIEGKLLQHQQQAYPGKQKIDVSRFNAEVILVKIGDTSEIIRLTK